jgi:hypothetical protein
MKIKMHVSRKMSFVKDFLFVIIVLKILILCEIIMEIVRESHTIGDIKVNRRIEVLATCSAKEIASLYSIWLGMNKKSFMKKAYNRVCFIFVYQSQFSWVPKN